MPYPWDFRREQRKGASKMATNAEPQKRKPHRTSFRGPRHTTKPMDRTIPVYSLSDIEIDALSSDFGNVSLWVAIGAVGAGLMLGCIWDLIEIPWSQISKIQWGFLAGTAIVSTIAFVISRSYRSKGKRLISRIKAQATID